MDVDSDSVRKILNNLIDSGLLPSLSLYYRSQINNLRVLIYSLDFVISFFFCPFDSTFNYSLSLLGLFLL